MTSKGPQVSLWASLFESRFCGDQRIQLQIELFADLKDQDMVCDFTCHLDFVQSHIIRQLQQEVSAFLFRDHIGNGFVIPGAAGCVTVEYGNRVIILQFEHRRNEIIVLKIT